MKRWIWRFVYRFRTDNNIMMMSFWALTGGLLIFNLLVFGIEPKDEAETIQGLYKEYFRMRGEDAPSWAKELLAGPGLFKKFWDWLQWGAWWSWFLILCWSIIYTPFSFRDEISRAGRIVWRRIRERRGSPAAIASKQKTEGIQTQQPLTFRRYLPWEFLSDFAAELLGHFVLRKRK